MATTEPLKPCPCCRGKAARSYNNHIGHTVSCSVCVLQTRHYETEEEAEAAWNRRPASPAPVEGEAILRALLERWLEFLPSEGECLDYAALNEGRVSEQGLLAQQIRNSLAVPVPARPEVETILAEMKAFEDAFIIAVGEKSPFAKIAISKFRKAREAVAAALRSPFAGAWQPMETAPRDQPILIYWKSVNDEPGEDGFAGFTICQSWQPGFAWLTSYHAWQPLAQPPQVTP